MSALDKNDYEIMGEIDKIIHDDVGRFLRNREAGSSASMNPSLDYTALRVVERMKELGYSRA